VPPAAVVIPNGTPPSASGWVAIQRVSGFPSPSTSRVGLVAAPDGWVAFFAVHPAGEDDDGVDDEDDDAADVDVPDADESPDDAHPATTSGASRPTARRGRRMTCTFVPTDVPCNDRPGVFGRARRAGVPDLHQDASVPERSHRELRERAPMTNRSVPLVFGIMAVTFVVLGLTGNGTVWFFVALVFAAVGAGSFLQLRR